MKVYNTKNKANFVKSIVDISNKLGIKIEYNSISNNCYRVVLKKDKFRKGADKVEGPLKMRKDSKTGAQKPGASAIEIDARINRKYR